MKIAYFDDNERRAAAFFLASHRVDNFADCELLNDRDDAVNFILDTMFVPKFIFIHFEFKDIPCEALVRFIRKQPHLDTTTVIVISDHFSRTDGLLFNELNVTSRLMQTDNLTEALTEILNPKKGLIRKLSNT